MKYSYFMGFVFAARLAHKIHLYALYCLNDCPLYRNYFKDDLK